MRPPGTPDRVGELTAHQLSTGSAIALFAGCFEWLAGRVLTWILLGPAVVRADRGRAENTRRG